MLGIPIRLTTSLSRAGIADRLRRVPIHRAVYLVAGPLLVCISSAQQRGPFLVARIVSHSNSSEIRGRFITGRTLYPLASVALLALTIPPLWRYLADGPHDVALKSLITAIMLVAYGLAGWFLVLIRRSLQADMEGQISLLQKTLGAHTTGKDGR